MTVKMCKMIGMRKGDLEAQAVVMSGCGVFFKPSWFEAADQVAGVLGLGTSPLHPSAASNCG